MKLGTAWKLARQTVTEWTDNHATTRAAALAYYTVFSIAPMVIIAIAIAGAVFGEAAARGEIERQIHGFVGEAGAKVIQDMVDSAAQPGRGTIATLIGIGALMFAATGAFSELQEALNAFWKAAPRKVNGLVSFLRTRVVSFAMVLCVGFLLVVSLVASAALSAVGNWVSTSYRREWADAVQLLNQVISFAGVTVLFALIYKMLPDRKVGWADVWLGAVVTSLLFNVGKFALAFYLTHGSVASSYGAAGSFAVLFIWVYYSSLILYLGAQFTYVFHAHRVEKRLKRKKEVRSWPSTPAGFPGTARSAGGH